MAADTPLSPPYLTHAPFDVPPTKPVCNAIHVVFSLV